MQPSTDFIVVVDRDVAVADQRCLGACAAHIERDHVGRTKPPPDLRGGDDPRGRTGLHDRGRLTRDRGGRSHSAARLHHRQRRGHATLGESGTDFADIGRDPRQNRRMHGGGAEALVFAVLAANRMAGHHGQASLTRDDVRGLPLVLRIPVAVQKRHDDDFRSQVL